MSHRDVKQLPSYSPYIPYIAQLLTSLCKKGDALGTQQSDTYDGLKVPPISVEDYMARWAKYSGCSPECFIIAVAYIDRLSKGVGLSLTSLNVHRVLLTALALAAKTRDDIYYSNKYYAAIGGIKLTDMNRLETQWLTDTNWDMLVAPEEYEQYRREFERHHQFHARQHGQGPRPPPAVRGEGGRRGSSTPRGSPRVGGSSFSKPSLCQGE